MALKNLFDMVKADRYTADGREELIKAQEAETEDKVYQIGEISQKTGLQKTANGWVKPKSGKQPAAKQEEPKNVHGAEVDKIYERQLKRIKELKAKGFTDEQIDNDKIIKQTKEDMKNVGKKPAEKHPPMVMPKGMSPAEFMKAWEDDAKKNGFKKGQGNEWREYLRKEEAESKPAAEKTSRDPMEEMRTTDKPMGTMQKQLDAGEHDDAIINTMGDMDALEDVARDIISPAFDAIGEDIPETYMKFAKRVVEKRYDKLHSDATQPEDAAPSLSEIVDRVYNIGEISEKTGLQKTANGWRPVKKGAAPAKKQQKKGAGIPQATTETFVGKTYKDFVESATPSGYKPTKNTDNPDGSSTTVFEKEGKQLKVDFDKSGKITKVTPGESKPALSQTDGKGNKVEIKITESKGGGFYVDKYVNGKKVGINNANTRESAEAKAKSMMEQHMADPDYRAESKPAAQEVKLGGGADTYYFEDPDNMSNEDKVFKSLGIELAETFGDHDGDPGNVETWANAWLDNTQNEGGLGIKSKKTRQPAAPVPAEEVMKIVEENPARWNRIIGNAKKFYEGKGNSTDFESDEHYPIKLVGGKTKPSSQYYAEGKRNKKNNPLTGSDSAPRQLTGDCRIRIRKEKPALTGDTKIRVRK